MGAIVGGVVGAVVGASVLLVGAVVFRILRYQRQRRRDQGVANAVPTTEVRELLPDSTAPSYHVPTLQNEVGSTIMGFYVRPISQSPNGDRLTHHHFLVCRTQMTHERIPRPWTR